ncbi:MAG TPA: DUF6580 family putative transport protein [Candidatus Saccharimonadia bacterium]|nr:DUF6580 family putative transport protein [Candidatus Saccharimonadia bacterium]
MDFRNERASRLLLIVGLVVAAALSRLIPHPPNFSPIEATALFAGAVFLDRRLALLVPIAAMLLSDFFLGFHGGMPVVYGCIALIAWFGRGLATKRSPLRIAAYGFAGAVFFFVATNLFVWLGSGMYPLSAAGLVACFTLALPFFANQLAGVAFYSVVLFGALALLEMGSETSLTPPVR